MKLRLFSLTALVAVVGLAALLPRAASAQATPPTRYIAFGDSITFGVGDAEARTEKGYPPRLQALLNTRGVSAVVENRGLPGETTGQALSRINRVLEDGGDVLLLMEGTNDVNDRVSNETIAFNLQRIAERAETAGLDVVHATVVPRLPTANYDRTNVVTENLAAEVRDLAWQNERLLADPFEAFFHLTTNFTTLYLGGDDKLHPNAAGYDLMARVFADVLTRADTMHPVLGEVSPRDGQEGVAASSPVSIELYDFGTGIDLPATRLLINGTEVAQTPIAGTSRKAQILYQPSQPFRGLVTVGLRTRDLANPANTFDRELVEFLVAGTVFLPGDIDRDGRVAGEDLIAFALAFGARQGEARYNDDADLNNDNRIDGQDLSILSANFARVSF